MKTIIESFEKQFDALHRRSIALIGNVPDDKLFFDPRVSTKNFVMHSCGEYVLRSAAAVEQTFGGIMTRLWDDPFEWTLPEELATGAKVAEYLREVEKTRRKGFAFFSSDDDLRKGIPAPETMKSIAEILIETVARAEHFQGRAVSVFQMFSAAKPPPI